jgi:hypothetical protein
LLDLAVPWNRRSTVVGGLDPHGALALVAKNCCFSFNAEVFMESFAKSKHFLQGRR